MNKHDIDTLANSVLTPVEYDNIINIASSKDNIFANMIDFDSKLGGAGIHNVNIGIAKYNELFNKSARPNSSVVNANV